MATSRQPPPLALTSVLPPRSLSCPDISWLPRDEAASPLCFYAADTGQAQRP